MRLLIREIRQQKHVTLKALGEAIGRKPHSVWEYENHKTRIPASLLYAIAQALGVSMNDLCTDDDEPRQRNGDAPPPTPRAALLALPPRRRRRGSRAPH